MSRLLPQRIAVFVVLKLCAGTFPEMHQTHPMFFMPTQFQHFQPAQSQPLPVSQDATAVSAGASQARPRAHGQVTTDGQCL